MEKSAKQQEDRGRVENQAVPEHKITKGAQVDSPVGRKPTAGESTENAGMSRNGLGKTH